MCAPWQVREAAPDSMGLAHGGMEGVKITNLCTSHALFL